MPLSTGTNIILRSGQDPDALAYFARAGIASGTQTPSSYDNAASFNGSTQFLSIPSNSTLTVTGTSFTYAFWANTPNTSNGMVISKTASTDIREFQISLNTGGVAEFRLFPDGTFANSLVIRTSASSFSANTWNFFVFRYDSSAATIGISINGGAFTSLGSIPAITQTNTNPLNLGAFVNTSGGLNYTGQLASVGFWKKALTASEVTQLWNAGAGRTYGSLDTGLRNNLISWWALNGTSSAVSLTDSHGVVTGTPNNLTNNGTVTASNIGPIVTSLTDSRRLISDFVRGIKSLGLWNSMVCWPLRSSQNASTTLTARSLGGLGTFDAALANFTNAATAWGSNGVITNGTTNLITSQLNYNLRQGSIFLYVQPTNSSNANYTSYGGGSSAGNGNFSLHVSSTGGTGLGVTQPNLNLANSSTANGLGFYGVAYSGGATSFSAWTIGGNNSSVSGAWGNTTGTPTILNLAYSSIPTEAVFGLMSLTMPVAVSFNAPLTQAQHIQLCLLYRSTIGLGL
jgi:hypothetical protein